MADLQEELKRQKDQLNTQKNVIVDREKELLKIEEKLTDETTQLKEKASTVARKQGLLPNFLFNIKNTYTTYWRSSFFATFASTKRTCYGQGSKVLGMFSEQWELARH